MVKDIQQASRQLNKRQMTWFRDDPMYQWLDAKQPIDALVRQIVDSMEESKHVGNLSHLTPCTCAAPCMGCNCWHAQKPDVVTISVQSIVDALVNMLAPGKSSFQPFKLALRDEV